MENLTEKYRGEISDNKKKQWVSHIDGSYDQSIVSIIHGIHCNCVRSIYFVFHICITKIRKGIDIFKEIFFISDFACHNILHEIKNFSVTTVSRRQSTGVAGTQLTAALNVSRTTGTGKAHLQ